MQTIKSCCILVQSQAMHLQYLRQIHNASRLQYMRQGATLVVEVILGKGACIQVSGNLLTRPGPGAKLTQVMTLCV